MADYAVYDWPIQRLLSALMNASARAGVSNSGLVVDLSDDNDLYEAHYLKSVVLARFDNVRPSVKPGQKFRTVSTLATEYTRTVHPLGGSHMGNCLVRGSTYTIREVWYLGSAGGWAYVVTDSSGRPMRGKYDAADFEALPE